MLSSWHSYGISTKFLKIFSDKRIRKNREFFEKVSLEQLIEAIKLVEIREVTPKTDWSRKID
jgi:hypothetical protein